jgi:hypothetical protein
MKILAIEKDEPGVADNMFTPEILKSEAGVAWELHQAGIIRELYFHKDKHYAVLILECKDEEEARLKLQTLPLVKNKLIAFELIPLVAYDGFARLFTKADI